MPRRPSSSEATDPYASRPNVLRLLFPSLIWGVVGVGFAVIVVFLFGFGKDRPGNVLYLVVGLPVIIVGYLVTVGVATIANRRHIARARELVPGHLAFVSRGNRVLTSALERFAQPGAPQAHGRLIYVAADQHGLSLWQGSPAEKLADVPWSMVSMIETTVSSVAGRTLPAIRLVVNVDGLSTPLLLIAPVSGGLGMATAPEAKWITGELDALRDAHPGATRR